MTHMHTHTPYTMIHNIHPVIVVLWVMSLCISISESSATFHFSSESIKTNIRKEAKSQWGEDIYLFENYFYGMVDGVVIESGALDGIFLSNSFMFERLFNWHSILIEANPKNYKRLRLAPRPKSTKIHAALCDSDTDSATGTDSTSHKVHYIVLEGRKNDNAISGYVLQCSTLTHSLIQLYLPCTMQQPSLVSSHVPTK